MPRIVETPSESPEPPKPKEERVEIRLDAELAERARKKAQKRGWTLSSVMRALLALWTDEDVISAEDVGRYADRAPKRSRKKNSASE